MNFNVGLMEKTVLGSSAGPSIHELKIQVELCTLYLVHNEKYTPILEEGKLIINDAGC